MLTMKEWLILKQNEPKGGEATRVLAHQTHDRYKAEPATPVTEGAIRQKDETTSRHLRNNLKNSHFLGRVERN